MENNPFDDPRFQEATAAASKLTREQADQLMEMILHQLTTEEVLNMVSDSEALAENSYDRALGSSTLAGIHKHINEIGVAVDARRRLLAELARRANQGT